MLAFNWNERKKNSKKEYYLLQQLQKEFEKDSSHIETQAWLTNLKMQDGKRIRLFLEGKNNLRADSLVSLLFYNSKALLFNSSTPTYDEIISSGNLSLIKSENLKTKISNSNERRIEAFQMFQQPDYRKRIVVQSGKEKVIILKVSSVKLIEIEQGVLFAHTELGKKFVIKETLTLSNIESTLNPRTFFRINKSQIVNIDFVSMYEQYGKNKVVIKLIGNENRTLITSVNRTPLFKDWVKK